MFEQICKLQSGSLGKLGIHQQMNLTTAGDGLGSSFKFVIGLMKLDKPHRVKKGDWDVLGQER